VLELDLRQQRHGINIAAGGRFFGPHLSLFIVTGAVPGLCKEILGATVARLGLSLVLTTNLIGAGQGRGEQQQVEKMFHLFISFKEIARSISGVREEKKGCVKAQHPTIGRETPPAEVSLHRRLI